MEFKQLIPDPYFAKVLSLKKISCINSAASRKPNYWTRSVSERERETVCVCVCVMYKVKRHNIQVFVKILTSLKLV